MELAVTIREGDLTGYTGNRALLSDVIRSVAVDSRTSTVQLIGGQADTIKKTTSG